MKKGSKQFVCQACGESYTRWAGKCDACDQWNTITEVVEADKFKLQHNKPVTSVKYIKPIPITDVKDSDTDRIVTGLSEFDLVLGGGIVPGSLVLIGGEPGVGKSTLILEISNRLSSTKKVLYVSGEESAAQIKLRAKRMNIDSKNILISTEIVVENIIDIILHEHPQVVFIDSIQTLNKESLYNQAGSVTQLRECTQILLEAAKKTGVPIFIIGHITKEGTIAGPKILEHLVDTVLYFEGDKLNYYRIIRAVKNRFGAVGDISIFEMSSSGLQEVKNKHGIFLSNISGERHGSVITAILEGSRAMSIEVQALVSRSSYSQSRRMAEGIDTRRLILMAAVIEKFLGLKMVECDIFSNIAGGLKADDPAIDLSVCASIISSYTERYIPVGTAIIGEVGLSGEVRPVTQIGLRLRELQGLGMKKVFFPKGNHKEVQGEFSMELVEIGSIQELFNIFGTEGF